MGDDSYIPDEFTQVDTTLYTARYEARGTLQGVLRRTDAAQLVTFGENSPDAAEVDQTQVLLQETINALTTSEGISSAEQLREATAKLAEVSQKLDSLKLVGPIVDIFNKPAPGANTDIVGGKIRMADFPGVTSILVNVALTTASVFNVTVSRGALTIFTIGVLESVALNAGDGYGPIEIGVSPNDYINFQVETDSIINRLVVYGKKS